METRRPGPEGERTVYWASAIAAALFLLALVFAASEFWLVQRSLIAQVVLGDATFTQRDHMANLVNEETGVRGYVATGNPQFLSIYFDALPRAAADLRDLRAMRLQGRAGVDFMKMLRIEALNEAYFRRELALVRSGAAPSARLQLLAGKARFDALREVQGNLGADLSRMWRTQREDTHIHARSGFAGTVAACGLLVLWWLAFVMVLRQTGAYRRSALRDALTGVLNRRGALASIESQINKQTMIFGVVFIDLDGFKKINDVYGHATGDAVLRAVATRLKSEVRPGDEVCRLGGDEFVCVISPPASVEHVRTIAARLRKTITSVYSIEGEDYIIGCSAGVCMYPEHGESADVLLAAADRAMYEAKARGGGVSEAVRQIRAG